MHRTTAGDARSDERANGSFAVAAAALLLAVAWSAAVTGPAGSWGLHQGGGREGLSLTLLEEGLRVVLVEELDRATGEAVRLAAGRGGLDTSSALDAVLAGWLPGRFPLELEGWRVELLRSEARLEAVGGAEAGAALGDALWSAALTVGVLASSDRMEGCSPLALSITVEGPPSSPNSVAGRASTLRGALEDPTGPVGYEARNALQALAQSRALDGERRPAWLLDASDVLWAVEAAAARVAAGRAVPLPSNTRVDLGAMVEQGVQGALESNLGWFDDYLCLGDGVLGFLGLDSTLERLGEVLSDLRDLEDSLRDMAAGAVRGLVGWVLDRYVSPEGQALGCAVDPDAAAEALRRIEALSLLTRQVLRDGSLARDAGVELARAAVEGAREAVGGGIGGPLGGLVDRLLDTLSGLVDGGDGALSTLAGHASRVMAAVALGVVQAGLACAYDSVVALRALSPGVGGAQVPSEPPDAADGWALEAAFGLESVVLEWDGTFHSEPGPLVSALTSRALTGLPTRPSPLGALPYVSTCTVTVSGSADLRAVIDGATGPGSASASWRVPVSLVLEVPVATGWRLEGVGYSPSATLLGDALSAARAVYGACAGALGWLVDRSADAASWVVAQARGLASDLVENAASMSAYTFSRTMWKVGEALWDRRLSDAVNGTWDLLFDLLADDVRDRFTWEFELLGLSVRLSLDVMRQQLLLAVTAGAVALDVTVRRLSDEHPPFGSQPVEGYGWAAFGEARLERGDGWALMTLDPLTVEHESVLTLQASWGEGPSGVLVLEAMSARRASRRSALRLSDVVEGGGLLSLGAWAGCVDAGIALEGRELDGGEAADLLHRSLKAAWMASVRGWRVGELARSLTSGDAGVFLERLLSELYAALCDRGERYVSSLEVFLEVDPPSPGWPDVRISLVLDRPLELLLPLSAWASGSLRALAASAAGGAPVGVAGALRRALAERVLVRTELVWGVDLPEWVLRGGGGGPPRVGLVLRGEANLAALSAIAGRELGEWEARLELLLRGVPGAALALVPGMGSPDWDWAEVTLARATLSDATAPEVLISQVLYDAEGRDVDLEFVELLNAGDRLLDIDGFALEDDDGTYELRGHMPLLPGRHLLVARNLSALRQRWGVPADAWGMGLRLENEGDSLTLLSPDGRALDTVAWEGALEGWEGLDAPEGRALRRLDGDDRPGEPSAWTVGWPEPRRSSTVGQGAA